MRVHETSLAEVKVLEPDVFEDERGFFMESWNACTFARAGINGRFVQDNHSRSAKNVLRGLHYQIQSAQGKLVRVVSGAVFDVAVDMRASSATLGQWVGVELSAENKKQLWIPAGFAHGFLSLCDATDLLYKCTDYYSANSERCILWDDTVIGIEWPLESGAAPILSSKDMTGLHFRDAETYS